MLFSTYRMESVYKSPDYHRGKSLILQALHAMRRWRRGGARELYFFVQFTVRYDKELSGAKPSYTKNKAAKCKRTMKSVKSVIICTLR